MAAQTRPFPEPPPGGIVEGLGRIILVLGAVAALVGLGGPLLIAPLSPPGPPILFSLRLLFFALAAAFVLFLQGARLTTTALWIVALASLVLSLISLRFPPFVHGNAEEGWRGMGMESLLLLGGLIRLSAHVLSGIFLGLALARLLKQPGQLLTVILCLAAGDAWLNIMGIGESAGEGHPVRMVLGLFPLALESPEFSVSFPEVLVLALFLEAGKLFRFPVLSTLAGAMIGFLIGSALCMKFLPLRSALPLFGLSLPLIGLWVLIGAWPRFRCSFGDIVRAILAGLLLFFLLRSFTALHRWTHPPFDPQPDPSYRRSLVELRDPDARPDGDMIRVGQVGID